MKCKKIFGVGLLAGLVILIVGMILTQLSNLIFPSLAVEYENISLFRPWEDPLMQLYWLYPFVLGLVLAWVWDKIKDIIKGKTLHQKAWNFAWFYFLLATIPGMFITYSSFQVSLGMVFLWAISGLLQVYFAGLLFAKMRK